MCMKEPFAKMSESKMNTKKRGKNGKKNAQPRRTSSSSRKYTIPAAMTAVCVTVTVIISVCMVLQAPIVSCKYEDLKLNYNIIPTQLQSTATTARHQHLIHCQTLGRPSTTQTQSTLYSTDSPYSSSSSFGYMNSNSNQVHDMSSVQLLEIKTNAARLSADPAPAPPPPPPGRGPGPPTAAAVCPYATNDVTILHHQVEALLYAQRFAESKACVNRIISLHFNRVERDAIHGLADSFMHPKTPDQTSPEAQQKLAQFAALRNAYAGTITGAVNAYHARQRNPQQTARDSFNSIQTPNDWPFRGPGRSTRSSNDHESDSIVPSPFPLVDPRQSESTGLDHRLRVKYALRDALHDRNTWPTQFFKSRQHKASVLSHYEEQLRAQRQALNRKG
jgi:hypothetical protein